MRCSDVQRKIKKEKNNAAAKKYFLNATQTISRVSIQLT